MGVALAERVVVDRKFKLQFAVDPAFMEKFKRVRSLLSTKYPNLSNFEMIFEKNETVQNKKPAGGDNGAGCRDHGESDKKGKKRGSTERTRHIQQAVRDQVFVRDGGRCAFIGTGGKRCEETGNREIDHSIPYAKGGDNSPENLRLLCATHNRLAAEKEYGRDHREKFYRRE
ncbi:MAG TPA: HNH endonuclease signature motif containing protein [Patescibacteria group bacterium]|nr:HNH endonuclease signature motif containing protein [Patescibacteria group bacterium]